ncbi:Carboxylesterase type B [Trinorchestia longiramus]|nr:Carboxylesterase type B [Trinorchestia longiramus]
MFLNSTERMRRNSSLVKDPQSAFGSHTNPSREFDFEERSPRGPFAYQKDQANNPRRDAFHSGKKSKLQWNELTHAERDLSNEQGHLGLVKEQENPGTLVPSFEGKKISGETRSAFVERGTHGTAVFIPRSHDRHIPTPTVATRYGQVQGFYRTLTVPPDILVADILESSKTFLEDSKSSHFETSRENSQDPHSAEGKTGLSARIAVYLGIPYATPPVNANRLSPTRAPTKWRGILAAVAAPPACPQRPPKPFQRLFQHQSEDCLYLNIYAPGSAAVSPVLVVVPGESYSWGSANAYDGGLLAAITRTVVVTVNYRLGVLGELGCWVCWSVTHGFLFFLLGFLNPNAEPHRPAVTNNGLMDQLAALHWLQENIASFGGDPGQVTVLGAGRAAAALNFLIISPAAAGAGLFKRAIMLSGSALSPWALVKDPAHYAQLTSTQLHCPVMRPSLPSLEEMISCLRNRTLKEIMEVSYLEIIEDFEADYGGVLMLVRPSITATTTSHHSPAHHHITAQHINTLQPNTSSHHSPAHEHITVQHIITSQSSTSSHHSPAHHHITVQHIITSQPSTSSPKNYLQVSFETPQFLSSMGPSVDGVTITHDWEVNMAKMGEEVMGEEVIGAEVMGEEVMGAEVMGEEVMGEEVMGEEVMGEEMMGKENRTPVDILLGVAEVAVVEFLSQKKLSDGFTEDYRDRIFRTFVTNNHRYHLQELVLAITAEYTDWSQPTPTQQQVMLSTLAAVHDASIVAPVTAAAVNFASKSTQLFYYVLNNKPGLQVLGVMRVMKVIQGCRGNEGDTDVAGGGGNAGDASDAGDTGGGGNVGNAGDAGGEGNAADADDKPDDSDGTRQPMAELAYILGAPMGVQYPLASANNHSQADVSVSLDFMNYVANFVRRGDPNHPNQDEKSPFERQKWVPFDPTLRHYLVIRAHSSRLKDHYRADQVALWNWLIPKLERVGSRHGSNSTFHRFVGGPGIFSGPTRPNSFLPPPASSSVYPNSSSINATFLPGNGSRYDLESGARNGTYRMAQDASVRDRHGHSSETVKSVGGKSRKHEMNGFGLPYTTALTLTAALGVTLLLLNILVLAAVHYRKNSQHKNQHNLVHGLPHSSLSPSHCETLHSSTTMRSIACTQDWPPEYTCFPENVAPIQSATSPEIQSQSDHYGQRQLEQQHQEQQQQQHQIRHQQEQIQQIHHQHLQQQAMQKQLSYDQHGSEDQSLKQLEPVEPLWQQQQEHLMQQHHQQQQHLLKLSQQQQVQQQQVQQHLQLDLTLPDNLQYHSVTDRGVADQEGSRHLAFPNQNGGRQCMLQDHLHNKDDPKDGNVGENQECISERIARIKGGSSTLKRAPSVTSTNGPNNSSTLKRNAHCSSSLRRNSFDVRGPTHENSSLNINLTDASTIKRNPTATLGAKRTATDTSTIKRNQVDSSTMKRSSTDISTIKRKAGAVSENIRNSPISSPVGSTFGGTLKLGMKPSPPPRSSSVPPSETASLQGDVNEAC